MNPMEQFKIQYKLSFSLIFLIYLKWPATKLKIGSLKLRQNYLTDLIFATKYICLVNKSDCTIKQNVNYLFILVQM